MMGFSPTHRKVSAFSFGRDAVVKVVLFLVAKEVIGRDCVELPTSPSNTSMRAPGV